MWLTGNERGVGNRVYNKLLQTKLFKKVKLELELDNLKNYETYNRSERKQVFAINSKFQIKRFK